MARRGGLTLAVPLSAFDPEKLVDELQREEEGLLGPSKSFVSSLVVEDEAGQPSISDTRCRFLVIDFDDSVLPLLADFDAETNPENVVPFDSDLPNGLPVSDGLAEEVRAWANSQNVGRVVFYSAREEPDVAGAKQPGAVPKKAGPKKVTNAMLVEQMAQLTAQVQTISAMQQSLVPPPTSSAAVVSGQSAGSGIAPKMPSVIGSLGGGDVAQILDVNLLGQASKAVGLPPRSRPAPKVPQFPARPSTVAPVPQELPVAADPATSSTDPMMNALTQQSSALTALVAHLTAGQDPLQELHLTGGSGATSSTRGVQKREKLQSELANGQSQFFVQVMQQMQQEVKPGTSGASYGGRFGGFWNLDAELPGANRWVPQSAGTRNHHVGAWSFDRQLDPERRAHGSRAPGPFGLCPRTSCCRLGSVESSLFDFVVGRAPGAALSGSNFDDDTSRTTVRPIDSLELVCNSPIVPERTRNSHKPQGRGWKSEDQSHAKGRRRRRESITKTTSQVSQKTSGRSEPRMNADRDACGEQPTPLNSDRAEPLIDVPHTLNEERSVGPSSRCNNLSSGLLSYPKWCAMLTANVLRSRCAFSKFCAISMKVPRSNASSAPTLFPIALPCDCPFDRMDSKLSFRKRARIHEQRALHIMVLALNYWHYGGSFVPLEQLGRRPSSLHLHVFSTLKRLLRSEVPAEPFAIVKAGRRFPQLNARLSELCEFTTNLGLSGQPYSRAFQGCEVPVDNSVSPDLEPYSSLKAERLKLTGQGHWDATSFLDDGLVLAYREPNSILCPREPNPWEKPCLNDPEEEIVRLAEVWDKNSLLGIHCCEVPENQKVKIFNCLKDPVQGVDRQIGDRRSRNAQEAILEGPSRLLPAGTDLSDLYCPQGFRFHIFCSDRKDFYHQLWASPSRMMSNTVGPSVDLSRLAHLNAYGVFLQHSSQKRYRRAHHGDLLAGELWKQETVSSRASIAFKSVLQGDHGGVEYATAAHESLLMRFGCLGSGSRLVANRPLYTSDFCDGLVTDDFFAVSVCPCFSSDKHSRAAIHHRHALEAYASESLIGSPLKDVLGADYAKIIGGVLNSSPHARSQGVATLSSPFEKRLSLSWMLLQVCQLSHTTDSLRLCLLGGVVSAFLYRRPLMSLLSKAFSLVNASEVSESKPKLVPLPRTICDELVLTAVLLPLALTDLSADFLPEVFATDSSKDKGAIVSCQLEPQIAEILFKSCKTKGAYTRLDQPQDEALRWAGLSEPGNDSKPKPHVDRPLAFRFDFVEIFAGSGKVTHYASLLGLSVSPPIDLSASQEYNLEWIHVMSWLSHLITSQSICSFMIEPPCTTFSIMRRPALRTFELPFGLNPCDEQTRVGNVLGHRGFQCLALGIRWGVAGLLETPFSSKLRYLPSWSTIERSPCASWCRTDSCQFGSPHLKSFRFLGVHLDLDPLRVRCQCKKKHVQVQGKFTEGSAIYTDALAERLAEVIHAAALSVLESRARDELLDVGGQENLLVNDVAVSSRWTLKSDWTFKKLRHINLQELAAVLRLSTDLVKLRRPVRFVALVDSIVVRGAVSKGRSSSRAIVSVLRRLCSTFLAGSLYATFAGKSLLDESWSDDDIIELASLPRLKRWAANWSRLVIFLLGPVVLHLHKRSLYPKPLPPSSVVAGCHMDFDSTLGFPGEGPFCPRSWCNLPARLLLFLSVLSVSLDFRSSFWGAAMPVTARSGADLRRAGARRGVPLIEGRRVLPATSQNREHLVAAFLAWTVEEGLDWETLMQSSHAYIDEINAILAAYGRLLYQVGRPYNHFAETLNGIAMKKPSLRRQLQSAWNVAYGWVQQEPGSHHAALPPQALIAILATALLWGWTRVAGCLALAFGAILRPGEVCAALRHQLLLPCDVFCTMQCAYLSILEPKTRFTAAKHQTAKLDAPDLLSIVEMAFSALPRDVRLWPYSSQTLRTRFRSLLQGLGLPTGVVDGRRPLDLGSLRAGGATWLLNVSENPDLTRRRGRWLNNKTMEIYVQEASSVLYLSTISEGARDRIFLLVRAFPTILLRVQQLSAANIQPHLWPFIFHPAGRVNRI